MYTLAAFDFDRQERTEMNTEQKKQRGQIRAAMFGHAIGDALGVPVEFRSRESLRNDPVIFYDHCSYQKIRIYMSHALLCQFDGPSHISLIHLFSRCPFSFFPFLSPLCYMHIRSSPAGKDHIVWKVQ